MGDRNHDHRAKKQRSQSITSKPHVHQSREAARDRKRERSKPVHLKAHQKQDKPYGTEALWTVVHGQEGIQLPRWQTRLFLNAQEPDSQKEANYSQYSANRLRRVLHKHGRRPDHGCICHFNLRLRSSRSSHFSGAAATPSFCVRTCWSCHMK